MRVSNSHCYQGIECLSSSRKKVIGKNWRPVKVEEWNHMVCILCIIAIMINKENTWGAGFNPFNGIRAVWPNRAAKIITYKQTIAQLGGKRKI